MERLRRLALYTTIATFLLISIGGFVRAAGAGLGCESWPKCFPWSWLPPVSVDQLPPDVDPAQFSFTKAWIEYVNRLIGVVIGFLILATAWAAVRYARHRKDLLWPALACVPLVAFQGWFGGQVVKYKLDPRLVSIHLFLALLLVALLTYVAVATRFDQPHPVRLTASPPARWRRFSVLTTVLLGVASVQIVLGALVRGTIDIEAKAAEANLAQGEVASGRSEWLSQVGLLDYVHRKTALLILILTAIGWYLARRADLNTGLRRVGVLNTVMVITQILAGAVLAYGGLPPAAQLVHVTLGAWLIGGLFLQYLLLRTPASTPPPGY